MTACTEHPAVRTRRVALAKLARWFPTRCEADREDAVHEALCAAIRLGRPGGIREVCGRAARALLGKQRQKAGGQQYSARSPATSIARAGHVNLDGEVLTPDEWIDSDLNFARTLDAEDALDAAHWAKVDAEAVAREAVGHLRDEGLSWAATAELLTRCGRPTSMTGARKLASGRQILDPQAAAEAAIAAVSALDQPRPRPRPEHAPPAWERPGYVPAQTHHDRVELLRRAERARHVVEVRHRNLDAAAKLLALVEQACEVAGGANMDLGRALGVDGNTVRRWRKADFLPDAEHVARMRVLVAQRTAGEP